MADIPSIFKPPSDSTAPAAINVNVISSNMEAGNSGTSIRVENNSTTPTTAEEERVTRFKKWLWPLLGIAVLVTAISLIAVSIQKLTSTEQGLEYTKRTKQLDDAAKTGGLHVGPPGFSFVKFPSVQITEEIPTSTCLSKDGLRIQYTVTFQYVMPANWLHPAVIKYRDYNKWSTLVAVAGNSAIQHTCSDFIVTDFQNQRGAIQAKMMENLQLYLEGPDKDGESGVYAQAISVSLTNIEMPIDYTSAIALKEEAAQDIELAINQRSQETTKARTALLSAQEEALKILDTARNDANITLTRARLVAEETLFSLQTEAEILVLVKEKLNLTTEGLLGYMANRLYAQAPTLRVQAQEPAKLSHKDEL